jgi:tRNA(Ile)-lysidine synthetase-like protein
VKPLERSALSALRAAGLGPGASVLAAVSGGPDSTALLCALDALRRPLRLRLAACHVRHGIRPGAETAADAAFVSALCEARGIPVSVRSLPEGACVERARREKRSLEEVAREARRAELHAEAAAAGADVIALGHTSDDQVETLLMRVLQGSDVQGLRGPGIRDDRIVRPLLTCTRREVTAYLGALGQDWREDPTNADPRFLRNRVRARLVPVLDESFGGWRSGLAALSTKMGLAADAMAAAAAALPWAREGSGFSVPLSDLDAAAPAVRMRSLMDLYDDIRAPGAPRRLPWRFLEPLASARIPPGLRLAGSGVLFEARGGRAWWGPDIARHGEKGYFMEVPLHGTIAAREAGVQVCLVRTAAGSAAVPGAVPFLEDQVEPPVVLRSRRRGDEVILGGGTVSVKELFDAWGIPEADRPGVPLLADRRGVLAVLGSARGYPCRVRDDADASGSGKGRDSGRIWVRLEDDREGGRQPAGRREQR